MSCHLVSSGQVKIGGLGAPSAAAMLELESTNRGFVPPRINLTSLTMNLDGGVPADGMVIFSTNTDTGVGLYTWYGGRWNKMAEKLETTTYAKFTATGSDANQRIQWTPQFMNQPSGLQPLWLSGSPAMIRVRTTGLYIVSASHRKTGVSSGYISIEASNGTKSYIQIAPGTTGGVSLSNTSLFYLSAGESLTVTIGSDGTPDYSDGSTQSTIYQIPSVTY